MKRFDGNINIKTDDVNIKRGGIPVSNVNLPSVRHGWCAPVLLSSLGVANHKFGIDTAHCDVCSYDCPLT